MATMANKKSLLVTLVGSASRFEAQCGQFFVKFDRSVVPLSCLDVEIWQFFFVDDNVNDNDRTNSPLARGNYCISLGVQQSLRVNHSEQ